MPQPQRWTYWLDGASRQIECGFWTGCRPPAQAVHFHQQAQITIVLAGSRHFLVGRRTWDVVAGQCIVIPAGIAHRSLEHAAPATRCLNLYASLAHARTATIIDTAKLDVDLEPFAPDAIVLAVERLLGAMRTPVSGVANRLKVQAVSLPDQPIGKLAADKGVTREAYTRGFTRAVGMAPHAYRLVLRLNAARQALASGASVADIAVQFGFADQSHFGRHYRRVFGITPRAYVDGMRAVTNVPDRMRRLR